MRNPAEDSNKRKILKKTLKEFKTEGVNYIFLIFSRGSKTTPLPKTRFSISLI